MPEFENREDKSASENAKALKHIFKSKMKSMKEEKWKDKALHGQYPKILEKPHVDTVATNKWLSSNLKGETEGLLVAAQDQAINTRNYQKVISDQQVESKCRMCSQREETVDHIVSGCEVLAKTEYISRHNNAAAYLHWSICKDHDIEITEKKSKYKDLELEIQRMWHMKTIVIPVVVGALGTVKKGMVENIKKVSERATVTEIQKICMLGSARILRKVFSI